MNIHWACRVTGGRSLYRFWGYTCPKNPAGDCEVAFGLSAWIVVFSAIQLVLIQVRSLQSAAVHSGDFVRQHCTLNYCLWLTFQLTCDLLQAPDFNALAGVSLLAAVMSLTYSTIGVGGSIATGRAPDTTYNLDGHSTADGIFGVFNALG